MTHGPFEATGDLASRLEAEVPRLSRFARSLVRDPSAAEDLVQEALTRAWERRDSLDDVRDLGAWLRRVVHNLAVDRARRTREFTVDEVEERWMRDEYTVDTAAVVERAETRAEVEDALVRLPFIYRTAVVLHDAEGMTVAEVADVTGVELPAAKQRLRRGRMMLVTALADGHERRIATQGVPLRCWDARRWVSDYLDGDVTPDVARQLERHLASCPTCPPLYAALVGVRDGMSRTRDPDSVIEPGTAERLRTRGLGTG
ncbi:MAG: sigma-70 family RNA polymerase sigma factor [Candidatus Nanopelagicales bacterium]